MKSIMSIIIIICPILATIPSCSDKISDDSGYIMPKKFYVVIKDKNNNTNMLSGQNPFCPIDSIKMDFDFLQNPAVIDFDTSMEAIYFTMQPNNYDSILGYILFCNSDKDTIKFRFWDVDFNESGQTPYYNFKFSFLYNGKLICNPCDYDTLYEVFK